MISELKSAVHGMVGSRCWSFAAEVNTGSCVSFEVGRRVQREKPLKPAPHNPHGAGAINSIVGSISKAAGF